MQTEAPRVQWDASVEDATAARPEFPTVTGASVPVSVPLALSSHVCAVESADAILRRLLLKTHRCPTNCTAGRPDECFFHHTSPLAHDVSAPIVEPRCSFAPATPDGELPQHDPERSRLLNSKGARRLACAWPRIDVPHTPIAYTPRCCSTDPFFRHPTVNRSSPRSSDRSRQAGVLRAIQLQSSSPSLELHLQLPEGTGSADSPPIRRPPTPRPDNLDHVAAKVAPRSCSSVGGGTAATAAVWPLHGAPRSP